MPPDQAAGLSEALSDTMGTELVTKADLKSELALLRADISVQIAQAKGELRTEISAVKSDLLRWIIPLFLSQMAFGVGVLLKLS